MLQLGCCFLAAPAPVWDLPLGSWDVAPRRGGQAQSTSSLSGHVCSVGMVSRNCEFNWSTTCLGFYLPVLPHLCLPEELVLRWCFLVVSPGIGHLF